MDSHQLRIVLFEMMYRTRNHLLGGDLFCLSIALICCGCCSGVGLQLLECV